MPQSHTWIDHLTHNDLHRTAAGPADAITIGTVGDDRLDGTPGDDTIDALAGNDTVFGGAGNDVIFGRSGNDRVQGGVGDDVLNGGNDKDRLFGDDGVDTIHGGRGGDIIIGGDGNDLMLGGYGHDVFVYLDLSDARFAEEGFEEAIDDLSNKDRVDLSAIDADVNTDGNQAFVLVDKFTGTAGELTINFDSEEGETYFKVDVDGDSNGDMLIELDGDHRDFTNFVL
jgi:Ca2+-binding RTX toxin-like protein